MSVRGRPDVPFAPTDSCKFLHDRSDYKHGWEIEQDWQREQQARKDEPEPDYTVFSDED